jgi:hypothetical protein
VYDVLVHVTHLAVVCIVVHQTLVQLLCACARSLCILSLAVSLMHLCHVRCCSQWLRCVMSSSVLSFLLLQVAPLLDVSVPFALAWEMLVLFISAYRFAHDYVHAACHLVFVLWQVVQTRSMLM